MTKFVFYGIIKKKTIDWHNPVEGIPNFIRKINYWDGNVPEIDDKGEKAYMKSENYHHERTDYDFATIAEYLDSAARGTEVTFKYKEREYGVFWFEGLFYVYALGGEENEKSYKTAEETLDYPIEDVTIRDIITSVKVTHRNV